MMMPRIGYKTWYDDYVERCPKKRRVDSTLHDEIKRDERCKKVFARFDGTRGRLFYCTVQ